MIKSMTAFGRARQTVNGRDITVELRSVNNRFLDCSVKLPRAFSYLEEKIKPHIQSRGISRGKLDVYISIDLLEAPATSIRIDHAYAAEYIAALQDLRDRFGLADDISTMRVAQNRDLFLFGKPEDNVDEDWEALRTVLDAALDAFLSAREREGANIERDIRGKLKQIESHVDQIDTLSAADTTGYRQRLEERLREMLQDNRIAFDENRILTECAIFADRIAVDEELVRLRSHFHGFDAILSSSEPAGRKLDFQLQETNREINTIGSKSANSSITALVVEVKCELEKIREQIQNVE